MIPRKTQSRDEETKANSRHNMLQYLVAGGIIPNLPNTAKVVCETVGSSIENETIPCFDAAGKRIPSEIGPMNM